MTTSHMDHLQTMTAGTHVIRDASALSHPFVTNKLPSEQRKHLETLPTSVFYTGVPPESYGYFSDKATEARYLKALFALRDRLLSFGGHHVLFLGIEDDLLTLLQHGQVWPGSNTKKQPACPGVLRARRFMGEPNQCHANSALYWEEHRAHDVFLATGYALAIDGIWRQHSWCVEVLAPGTVRAIDSTYTPVAYYGFVMPEDQAAEFLDNNL